MANTGYSSQQIYPTTVIIKQGFKIVLIFEYSCWIFFFLLYNPTVLGVE